MKKESSAKDYLDRYGASQKWKIYAESIQGIRQVVVIPAYAEREMLFKTLASLADNRASLLNQTLVICVINNKENAPRWIRDNNAETIRILEACIQRRLFDLRRCLHESQMELELFQRIVSSGLRIAHIDASSSGLEIPQREGGVGMARKIGMDMAIRLLEGSGDGNLRFILSLDADTLVRPDYLEAVLSSFPKKASAAVISYEHQMPLSTVERQAICVYEIFLRYWVWGLQYAESPYAFHSIGSTIVTTTEAYIAVRGMNRREAGEDFYFLNKLAKVGSVFNLTGTIVYPSARISRRVPFGTGATIEKISATHYLNFGFYDPVVFQILKSWLELIRTSYHRDADQILHDAKRIHRGLEDFLILKKFSSVWAKIQKNAKDSVVFERQCHGWFDGFVTLKLINFLTRNYFPKISAHAAIKKMISLENTQFSLASNDSWVWDILTYLRRRSKKTNAP